MDDGLERDRVPDNFLDTQDDLGLRVAELERLVVTLAQGDGRWGAWERNPDDGVTSLSVGEDSVGIGTGEAEGKVHVKGDSNEVQLIVEASSAQSNSIQSIRSFGGGEVGGWNKDGVVFSNKGTSITNFFSGYNAGNSSATAVNSVGIGDGSLASLAGGHNNVCAGARAGHSVADGQQNLGIGSFSITSLVSGLNNCGIGHSALRDILSNDNVGVGALAGRGNDHERCLFVGSQAGYLSDGDLNMYFGYKTGVGLTESSRLRIGYNGSSLVYGEFDNELIVINGRLRITDNADTPAAGDLRYNSTTNKHQGYDGSSWNDLY
ncbi:hypothetical protein DRO03_07225 [Methanosarcinales archaeon]|nr:MAG: hypothetical protein DRO03_07225 [Methanosarcinales archaeon]